MASHNGRQIINAYGKSVPRGPAEEDCLAIGPATHILGAACGGDGALRYAIPGQQGREFPLGVEFAGRPFNIIDTLRAAWLLDPGTNHLTAVSGFGSGPARIFFFGEFWGAWIDDKGRRQRSQDPVAMMKHFKIPVYFEPRTFQFGCEFNISTQMREGFVEDARRSFQPGPLQHQLVLLFETPIGNHMGARMLISDRNSAGGGWSYGIDEFPLRWPKGGARAQAPPAPPAASQPPGAAGFGVPYKGTRYVFVEPSSPAPPAADGAPKLRLRPRESEPPAPQEEPAGKIKLKPKAPAPADDFGMPEVLRRDAPTAPRIALRPRPAPPPQEPPPDRARLRPAEPPPSVSAQEAQRGHLTSSLHQMPVSDLIAAINAKPHDDERWKIIESNLMLRRSERTYPLLSRYADLIAERTLAWPSSRLKSVFGDIPGGVLIGVMYEWHVNQILAVAEGNPEEARILEWLRERESERLLQHDPGHSVSMPETARRLLRVDRNADAPAIDRACHALILFLETTGDKSTKMTSRKTEELAERLLMARDVLIRNLR